MGIISEYIEHRFNNKLNSSVIVSGLSRSGKSTMLSSLVTKYYYNKFVYNEDDMNYINPTTYKSYQLFDRSPLIELYVYCDPDKVRTTEEIEFQKKYIKEMLPYYNDPFFIIYLHNLWDTSDKESWKYEYESNIKLRYLDIVEILIKMNKHVVLCNEKSIRSWN
jgi:GTPase SAR1 family protein